MSKEYYENKFKCLFGDQGPTPVGRCIYVHLDEPYTNSAAFAPKYSLNVIWDKEDAATVEKLKEFKKLALALIVYKFGKDKEKWPRLAKPIVRDGDDTEYSDLQGKYYIQATCSEDAPPELYDSELKPVSAEEILPGCLVRALVQPMITAKNEIAYRLLAVQFVKDDGTRYFGGGLNPKALMGAIEGEETETETESENEVEDDEDNTPKRKRGRPSSNAAGKGAAQRSEVDTGAEGSLEEEYESALESPKSKPGKAAQVQQASDRAEPDDFDIPDDLDFGDDELGDVGPSSKPASAGKGSGFAGSPRSGRPVGKSKAVEL